MKIEREAGILEIGNLEELDEGSGVVLRTDMGEEIIIPLLKSEAREIGKEGLLCTNLKITITLEATEETT